MSKLILFFFSSFTIVPQKILVSAVFLQNLSLDNNSKLDFFFILQCKPMSLLNNNLILIYDFKKKMLLFNFCCIFILFLIFNSLILIDFCQQISLISLYNASSLFCIITSFGFSFLNISLITSI